MDDLSPNIPAQCIKQSIDLKLRSILSASDEYCSESAVSKSSCAIVGVELDSAVISSYIDSNFSLFLPLSITFPPNLAASIASDLPIPSVAPVMNMTLSLKASTLGRVRRRNPMLASF